LPEKLDSCVRDLIAKGKPEASAWALCRASLDMSEATEADQVSVGTLLGSAPESAWPAMREAYRVARTRLGQNHEQAVSKLRELPTYLGFHNVSGVGWLREFKAPQTRSVMGVEIFAAGTWTDSAGTTRVWTEADLDQMVANARANHPERRPVKAGHTSGTFNRNLAAALSVPEAIITGEQGGQGQIALGNAVNLRRQGDRLLADFADVPQPVADMIELKGNAGFCNVSSEITIGDAGPAIVGVALLGAENPAVDVLAGLEAALVMAAPGKQVYRFARSDGHISQETAEADLTTIETKLQESIKGSKSAGILARLFADARERLTVLFRGDNNESADHADGEDQMLEKMRQMLGLPPDATEEAVLAKIRGMMGGKEGQHSADFSKSAEFQELTGQVTALQAENGTMRTAERVAKFSARAQPWLVAGVIKDVAATATELASLTDAQAEQVATVYDNVAAKFKEANLFSVRSTPRVGDGMGDAEVEAAITELQKGGKSREQAVSALASTKPGLFRRYQAANIVTVFVNGREE